MIRRGRRLRGDGLWLFASFALITTVSVVSLADVAGWPFHTAAGVVLAGFGLAGAAGKVAARRARSMADSGRATRPGP